MDEMELKEKIVAVGKYLFLAGVVLLIVRNNSYPFFIKRSSDILFFLSAIAALFIIIRFKDGYQKFLQGKNILISLALICFGLIFASLSGYFSEGLGFTKEGVFNIGRFAEVFLIVFLVSFFQNFDGNFYKKAALSQLSTLVYLPALLLPNADFAMAMYRFELFENWPSNVGYYLIASLTCISVLALEKTAPFKKTFIFYYVLGIGLFAIFLWAQSRAAWLGFGASLFLLLIFGIKSNFKKIAASALAAIIAFLLGFSILQPQTKNMVMARIFPMIADFSAPGNDTGTLTVRPESGLLIEPYRLELWKIYANKLAERPLGFGVNYEPVNVGAGPQGPHNTILEFLVLAGPVGLAGFILLLFSAFKNILIKIKNVSIQNRLWLVYLFSSLAGLLVAAMFDNMSLFRLIWLLAGMAIYA